MYTAIKKSDDFAALIKARRDEIDLNQETLADYQGLSRFTLGNIEKGKADPKLGTILKLLEGLGLSLVAIPNGDLQRVLSIGQASSMLAGPIAEVSLDDLGLDDMDSLDLSLSKKAP